MCVRSKKNVLQVKRWLLFQTLLTTLWGDQSLSGSSPTIHKQQGDIIQSFSSFSLLGRVSFPTTSELLCTTVLWQTKVVICNLISWSPGQAILPQILLSTEPRVAAVRSSFHTNLDLARVWNGDVSQAQKYWMPAFHAATLLGQWLAEMALILFKPSRHCHNIINSNSEGINKR